MYYSKSGSALSIPSNYSGNAFRVTDESDRTYKREASETADNIVPNGTAGERGDKEANENENENESTIKTKSGALHLPTVLSDINAEDVLILGLIFLIHRDNPTDPTLLLLLTLLLVKG